jgi:hypothetical protein
MAAPLALILLLAQAPDPRFPSAGVVLATAPAPGQAPAAIDYDRGSRTLWVGDQVMALPPAGQVNLYRLDPLTLAVVSSMSVINLRNPDTSKAWDGAVNGLSVTRDGTLLLGDFNGDGVTLDDPLVEVDPAGGTLLNSWRLDDSCPASCLPSTNTNVPRVRLSDLRGNACVDTSLTDPPFRQTVLVSSARESAYAVVELTPGRPGTWFRRATVFPPFIGSPAGLSWDSRLQSLWVNDRGPANLIYEAKLTLPSGPLALVQAFPSDSASLGIELATLDGLDLPPHLVEVGATPPVLTRYDSGHSGARFESQLGPAGSGHAEVRLVEDPQNEGLPYAAVACFSTTSSFAIGDGRVLRFEADAAFEATVRMPENPPWWTGFGGFFRVTEGTPTPLNPPVARIVIDVRELTGIRLHLLWATAGGATDVKQVRSTSPPFSIVLP